MGAGHLLHGTGTFFICPHFFPEVHQRKLRRFLKCSWLCPSEWCDVVQISFAVYNCLFEDLLLEGLPVPTAVSHVMHWVKFPQLGEVSTSVWLLCFPNLQACESTRHHESFLENLKI